MTLLANLYARAGFGREEAIAKYRQVIAIDPAVAEAHFGLATLYLKDDDFAEARGPIEEAVRLSPWNPRYLETLAYVRDHGGDAGQALDLYRHVVILDGDYLSPYFEIVSLQRRLGHLTEALATGQRLAALLDDKRITDLPKNQKTLYFPAGDGAVYLRTLEEKRCYAYSTLSATAYLLEQSDAARDYAARAKPAVFPNDGKVSRLVASDLRRLKETQPTVGARIDQYLAEYLNRRPQQKAARGD
jgi:tetratricopeptide (TPR) repeat protein